MTPVRFFNTTTLLPIDKALTDGFWRIIDPAFLAAIKKRSQNSYVDVQFVGRRARAQDRDHIPDTDVLGVYVSHDRTTHQPTIKVFPERVLDACKSWNNRIDGSLSFAERYPTLLYKVIVHELAHYLMDDRSLTIKSCRVKSWIDYLSYMKSNADNDPEDKLADESVPDSRAEDWMRESLFAKAKSCNHIMHMHSRHRPLIPHVRQMHKTVEESLANAFVLRQQFGARQIAALRVFIESQSASYRAGLKWPGSNLLMLKRGSQWRTFKAEFIGIGGRREMERWNKASSAQKPKLKLLVASLLDPSVSETHYDIPQIM